MVRILEEADLARPQQAVLVAMAENANDDGSRCFPSVDLIAWKAGYKPRNVVDIIRELRAIGVLEEVVPATAQRPTEYTIRIENAPRKMTFEEWQKANGRHAERAKREPRGAQSHVSEERENAPVQNDEGCNLTSTGVQSHVSGVQSHVKNDELARENAPEPVIDPVKEPVRDPVILGRAKRKAAETAAPDSIDVTDDMRQKAIGYGLAPGEIDTQTELFLNHHRAKGTMFRDWRAAWYTWMQRAPVYRPKSTGTGRSSPPGGDALARRRAARETEARTR